MPSPLAFAAVELQGKCAQIAPLRCPRCHKVVLYAFSPSGRSVSDSSYGYELIPKAARLQLCGTRYRFPALKVMPSNLRGKVPILALPRRSALNCPARESWLPDYTRNRWEWYRARERSGRHDCLRDFFARYVVDPLFRAEHPSRWVRVGLGHLGIGHSLIAAECEDERTSLFIIDSEIGPTLPPVLEETCYACGSPSISRYRVIATTTAYCLVACPLCGYVHQIDPWAYVMSAGIRAWEPLRAFFRTGGTIAGDYIGLPELLLNSEESTETLDWGHFQINERMAQCESNLGTLVKRGLVSSDWSTTFSGDDAVDNAAVEWCREQRVRDSRWHLPVALKSLRSGGEPPGAPHGTCPRCWGGASYRIEIPQLVRGNVALSRCLGCDALFTVPGELKHDERAALGRFLRIAGVCERLDGWGWVALLKYLARTRGSVS